MPRDGFPGTTVRLCARAWTQTAVGQLVSPLCILSRAAAGVSCVPLGVSGGASSHWPCCSWSRLCAGQALSGHVGAPLLTTRETAALLGGPATPGRAVEAADHLKPWVVSAGAGAPGEGWLESAPAAGEMLPGQTAEQLMPKSASTRYRVENRYRPSDEQQPEPEPEPQPQPEPEPPQQHPQPSEQDEEEEEEDAPEPQAVQQKLPPPQRGRRTSMTMATVVSMTQVRQRRINTSFAKSQSQPRVAEAKARTSRTRSQMWLSDNAVEITVSTSATHGQLEFAEGREVLNPAASSLEEARQARFMRVEGDSRRFSELDKQGQLERAKSLAGLVEFMRHSWGMQMPSVIFAVTGSANEFELRPKFRDAFMSALLNATRSTNAWIVTGGSDTGIMKLVGDALARGKQMETAIGIAAYSTVRGRTELTADSSAQAELQASMPDCTVRVEVDDPYIYTEEKLNEIYSRHGVVVGVSLSKEGGFLKFLVKKSLSALRAAGAGGNGQGAAGLTPQTSEGATKFALITFRSSEEATHACTNVVRVANQDRHEVELRAKPFEDGANGAAAASRAPSTSVCCLRSISHQATNWGGLWCTCT